MENYYAVIMAGGGGTRLWPLSRQSHPKQMLRLVDDRSLFQIAVDRLRGLFPPERVYVVTVADQAQALQEQCPQIPAENYLLEPMPRGTASVVGLAAIALQNRDAQAVMAVLTADHIIQDEEKFRGILKSAYDVARDGYLVTLGITPTHPATGYGYIQQGERIAKYGESDVFHSLGFREKPRREIAEKMLAGGDHTWNSGMFVWTVERILGEFAQQMPGLHSKLAEISRAWDQPQRQEVILRLWPGIQPQTIDYGIMEKAQKVAVIPAKGLGWSDVGSWDALFEVLPADQDGNITRGVNHISVDTRDSMIFSSNAQRLIVTIGVEGLVIVDTGDALLICRKDQTQKLRQVVGELKASSHQEYI